MSGAEWAAIIAAVVVILVAGPVVVMGVLTRDRDRGRHRDDAGKREDR